MIDDIRTPTLDLSRDLDAIRALFPVTQTQTYLMNAAQSPLNTHGRAKIDEYLDLAAVNPSETPTPRQTIRRLLAGLFGGNTGDYSVTTNTGMGINTVATGLPWRAGDNVVLPAGEHWNSTFPWLNLQNRGVTIRMVQPDADNRILVDDIAAQVDDRTRVISVNATRFDTGFRVDLRGLAGLARVHGALLVVDGIQGAGANEINVLDDGIDVLSCGGFKWLLGQKGTGFLYTNDRARARILPSSPGMYSAEHSFTELNFHDDARRYETGTMAHALLHGWVPGLQLLTDIGVENIAARNLQLTDRLIAGLEETKNHVLTPVQKNQERSAIVSFTTGSDTGDQRLYKKLETAQVKVSQRTGSLRISPNFFNTESEIDQFLNCL